MEISELFRVIARRWRIVVVTPLILLVAAGALTQMTAPTYQSQTRLYLSSAQTSSATDAYQLGVYAQQRLASYAELATDPSVLRGAIRRAGVAMTPRELAEQVSATAIPGTVVLEIAVRDPDARQAQDLAKAEAEEVVDLVNRLETAEQEAGSDEPTPRAPIVARVAGEATLDFNPVAPNLTLNLMLALLAGLVLGVIAAALRDRADSTVKTAEDVASVTDLPLLVGVPFEAGLDAHPLISDPGARRERIEVYRILRSKLQFAALDGRQEVVLVTSAVADEGKSVTAANLAVSLALRGTRVLLLDLDLRQPSAARLMDLDNSVGVMSALLGRIELDGAIQQHESGVDFLATGPLPPNPAEVIETQAMSLLIDDLRGRYDVVVIDAPPLLPVVDPALLARVADQVVVVTRHGSIQRRLLAAALDRLPTVGARVVGVVLTMVPSRRGMLGGGYGYGYGDNAEVPIARAPSDESATESAGGGRRIRRA